MGTKQGRTKTLVDARTGEVVGSGPIGIERIIYPRHVID
ncbi:hypothetical protein DB30_04902 [Enhygromyxa salina]|uniref:Uncharacterized protein n=1 Tax=Enhygromyxa salina TaxID=215803 RepID=A0A0C1ZEV5_9BACT|nr:hypothetical protein DB30_04902 [Enhygromyxa salina]